MTEQSDDLIERLREALGTETITERKMFGVHCMLVGGKMVACAGKDGGLLVRVDGTRHDELLTRPGAEQAEMGQGRSMGDGWIWVRPDGLESDEALDGWIDDAMVFNRAQLA